MATYATPRSFSVASLLTIALAFVIGASASSQPGAWHTARVTRYGGAGDPWTIHYGSCGYYYLDPNKATGWNVAAMSDANNDFSGSCGRCYEIACQNMNFKDGYGAYMDRSHVCYDESASLVIQITDSCPCVYPKNAYSNKRWCCGDMYHMDLSQWAFERLADPKWGVIGIKMRWVPCDYKVAREPNKLANPSKPAQGPPAGWNPSKDKRPFP